MTHMPELGMSLVEWVDHLRGTWPEHKAVREYDLFLELYRELIGCKWVRMDGGENKLAVTMANLERHIRS